MQKVGLFEAGLVVCDAGYIVCGNTGRDMDGNVTPRNDGAEGDGDLPPIGHGVFVLHNGQQRIAYLDAAGLWRNYESGDVLKGDVRILPDGGLETRG